MNGCLVCDDFKKERADLKRGSWVWVTCHACGDEVLPPHPKKEVSP